MARVCRGVFEQFRSARVNFVQEVATMAAKPDLIAVMHEEGVIHQLHPMLSDDLPSVQHSAALALGRLANYSVDLAEEIVDQQILPPLVSALTSDNKYFMKSGSFALRSVAKHSAQLAELVVEAGALEPLVRCLEHFDATVKEAAAFALSYVAGHSEDLATAVVDAGAVPLLVLSVQEPEVGLKRVCASALSEISKHSQELAHTVAAEGAVPHLSRLLRHDDAKVKRQACACLSNVAKHNVDLAEAVVESNVIPRIMPCLKDPDAFVRKFSAIAVRDVVKHSEALSSVVVSAGGGAALVEYVNTTKRNPALAGITALGYIASFSESLAMSIIEAQAVPALKEALLEEEEDHLRAAAAWALGMLGRHSSDHARPLAEADVLRHLLNTALDDASSDDLHDKCDRALRAIVSQCTYLTAMQPLLDRAPPTILRVVLAQFEKVVPTDPAMRRALVQSGGLRAVQAVHQGDEAVAAMVESINSNYPEEVVAYCSPDFSQTLADRIDAQ